MDRLQSTGSLSPQDLKPWLGRGIGAEDLALCPATDRDGSLAHYIIIENRLYVTEPPLQVPVMP